MTTNTTSTAMSAVVKSMPSGLQSKGVSYAYSGTDITASANALTVQLVKIPHGAQITDIVYVSSSGAATCPTDLGIEVTSGATAISAFASQLTIGSVHQVSPLVGPLPYLVSCPDSQVTQYAKIYAGLTPGTATSSIQLAINVTYTMDGNA